MKHTPPASITKRRIMNTENQPTLFLTFAAFLGSRNGLLPGVSSKSSITQSENRHSLRNELASPSHQNYSGQRALPTHTVMYFTPRQLETLPNEQSVGWTAPVAATAGEHDEPLHPNKKCRPKKGLQPFSVCCWPQAIIARCSRKDASH